MKKITCISYHATGSGAVDDYLREFSGIWYGPSEYECRFLQDPDGIADLEYNLIENRHRLNSGFALKRYLQYVKVRKHTYKAIFGDAWIKCSTEYVDSLITEKYKGYWYEDLTLNPFYGFYQKARRGINLIKPRRFKEPCWKNYFPNIDYYHVNIDRNYFLQATKKYIDNLCIACNGDKYDYFMLDQLVPTTNISRYLDYVNDLKVIIVDRDPRDVFIQLVSVNDHVLPKNAKIFAKVYKDHRKMSDIGYISDNVLKIQFEDLIYKYDETTQRIRDFLSLDESKHINKGKILIPEKSMKNTKLWISKPEYSAQAELIAKLLPEYIYSY